MTTAASGPPAGSDAGPPPPSGPPDLPPATPSPRPPWLIPVAVLVASLLIVLILTSIGGDDDTTTIAGGVTDTTMAAPGEIFLEAAAVSGDDPFAPSVAAPGPTTTIPPDTPVTLGTAPPNGPAPTAPVFRRDPSPPTGGTAAIQARSGATPGLYGGTRNQASCDQQKMVDFLAANPDKARAFAEVQAIPVDQVGSFVLGLTPALLRDDTRVTNHGFSNGRPTARQTVLQAGTAVMVDQRGVPRVRCACGNPLLPPEAVASAPTYQGTPWPGFNPTNVTVVSASPININILTLVDVTNGQPYGKPTGPGAGPDVDLPPQTTTTTTPPTTAPPATAPPATAPPVTITPPTGPGTTLPVVTVPQPPTTRPPTTTPPTTPPTSPPATTPPTTAAPITTWTFRETKFAQTQFPPTQTAEMAVVRQPSPSGGELLFTYRDTGIFCTGGGTEQLRVSWSFARNPTTLRHGDTLSVSYRLELAGSTGGCAGGVADKSYVALTGGVGSGGFAASTFPRPVDGGRFEGRGERATRASPNASGTVTVASRPSNPALPDAYFVFDVALPGATFLPMYLYGLG